MNRNALKIAVVGGLFLLFSLPASAIPPDSLLAVYGGGSINKEAVEKIVYEAITNVIWYIDWEEGASLNDGTSDFAPNSPDPQTLEANTASFSVASDPSIKAIPLFEVYAPEDTPVYVASTENEQGKSYDLVFTCSTLGTPIDFKLVITLMPYDGVGTASKIIIFNLRRSF